MDIDSLLRRLRLTNFLNIGIKLFAVLSAVFYTVFAIVMIRQVQVMKKTVAIKDYGLLSFLALIQLGAALILLTYSLFIL